MRNLYVDLCLQVQALRRDVESIRTPLAPAIGIAAELYTHQIANVHRILTDVRIRHLLADEVGLGKTVQALMVLNALRSQRPDLRALIFVPDQLVTQWRDEIMTRAHTAPFGEEGGAEGEQYVRLAWEDQLKARGADGERAFSLSEVDPTSFDILIVDELHRLTADVQDRITRVAADFEHLLILTATPAFQEPDRHAQLFALLEPERTALARHLIAASERGRTDQLSASDDLSSWPSWAATELVGALLEHDRRAASGLDDEQLTVTAQAHCAYRRFIRTRRADYRDVLPQREHLPIVVEPLDAEAERQALMWRYFEHLDDLTRRFDPVRLAKRVVLSPPSLQQRVDFLRRQGHDREGLLERVKPLVHRRNGDSRADALVDLLAAIWRKDPTDRVLVAAQDNLTVDYLFDLVRARLPMIGPLSQRRELIAARIRQGMTTEAVDDLSGYGNETDENLAAFQHGDAQILFAPEAVQVGLNLQCANALVLYSVPWRPAEVEQWIGRLDRIGNPAASAKGGSAQNIAVYTIAQRGLVDEQVVNILKHFRVFERSVNLDGDHLNEVAELIEEAALRPNQTNWRELEQATKAMAALDEVKELNSPLRPHLPWTALSARAVHERLELMPPVEPVLNQPPADSAHGPAAWDRALGGMLRLLERAGEYHLRRNTDPNTGYRFQTLWYQFGLPGLSGRREVKSKVVFSFGADPSSERNPRYAHAFITQRRLISVPPKRSVVMKREADDVRRPLRFLSFGDPLHDELIKGWLPDDEELTMLTVSLFEDHQLWSYRGEGSYLVRITTLDPADLLCQDNVLERAFTAIGQASTRVAPDRFAELAGALRPLIHSAIEADVRWLRSQLSAAMSLEVRLRDGGQWAQIPLEEARALLNPLAHGRKGVPRSHKDTPAERLVRDAKEELLRQRRAADDGAALSLWSPRLPALRAAIAARVELLKAEAHDALELAAAQLKVAQDGILIAQERGNRGQITRAQNHRDELADRLDMLRALWDERICWVQECEERLRSLRPRERLVAMIRTRRLR